MTTTDNHIDVEATVAAERLHLPHSPVFAIPLNVSVISVLRTQLRIFIYIPLLVYLVKWHVKHGFLLIYYSKCSEHLFHSWIVWIGILCINSLLSPLFSTMSLSFSLSLYISSVMNDEFDIWWVVSPSAIENLHSMPWILCFFVVNLSSVCVWKNSSNWTWK